MVDLSIVMLVYQRVYHDIPHYITVLPYFTHENPMQNPMEKIPHEITI